MTVRNIAALLKKESDTGWVVTSGRFTKESRRFARECKNNIRLIDGEELVTLWVAAYNGLPQADKMRLPIHPVYFLGQ
jgi:restriction endonuclease Mrr